MGKQPRLLFVHGSVVNAELTWAAQKPLADRFELVLPNRRGFPPGPDVDHVDFEDEAVWFEQFLEPETHVVGHSYGGVIALLLAAAHPEELGSLTVIEPPATAVARGVPAVDAFVAGAEHLWSEGPRDPGAFLRAFFTAVGTPVPTGEFNAALLQGARTLMVERLPSEAEIPLDTLAAAPFPKLVVTGAHHAAFESIADVLEERLPAERLTFPGVGHSVQRLGAPFNDALATFVLRTEAMSA
ncbi:MAG TPA: alpha/beta fold hydrolase [Gaiellaceae bacterium]|jgi:pimeloyl-ACP methyl ester carboxylesterase